MKIISPHRGGKAHGSSASAVKHPRAASPVAGKSKSVAKAAVKARHGNGHGNGNGHSTRRAKPGATPVAQARYDTGLRYDSGVRYVTDDPVPPVPTPGTAKVKLELGGRTDPALAAFGESHILATTDNPWFPTPLPSPTVFAAKLAEFESLLSQLENLRLEAKNLTEQKDQVRKEFELLFIRRGNYVQFTSQGDAEVIVSAGLATRNPPSPAGVMPWPQNLKVEQTQVNGQFLVRWMSVPGAKGYLLQCAEVVAGQERVWVNAYAAGKFSTRVKDLTPGKTYEFRVAANGGSTGQSDFSPVVQRMAA